MKKNCTIQAFLRNQWHTIATVSLISPQQKGYQASTCLTYDITWAVEHTDKIDANALGARHPVRIDQTELPHWPVFLIDLLPQGFAGGELLNILGLPSRSEAAGDWPLLLHGAGNPIGHLRILEAHAWLQTQASTTKGFTRDEVSNKAEHFIEHMASHGLFVAGSSGVQGEWPKVLLTQAKDGLFYLDHTLNDEDAQTHYIVKFNRGENKALQTILQMEPVYMKLAMHLGLRCHCALELQQGALFIPRFDRKSKQGKVLRFGQESIASLAGVTGFERLPTHQMICELLAQVCTNPLENIIEYIKRDIANLALGNKDNHARNTAIQRFDNGEIQLTPLFDFAPMYLHPDGISRRMRWADELSKPIDWRQITDQIAQSCTINSADLRTGLKSMLNPLQQIDTHGIEMGLTEEIHAFLKPAIRRQIDLLNLL